MPKPITKQVAATCHTELLDDSKSSKPEPITITAAPMSAVLRKPILKKIRPASEAANGQPRVRGANAKPATSALVPSTPWAFSGTNDVRPISITHKPRAARLVELRGRV